MHSKPLDCMYLIVRPSLLLSVDGVDPIAVTHGSDWEPPASKGAQVVFTQRRASWRRRTTELLTVLLISSACSERDAEQSPDLLTPTTGAAVSTSTQPLEATISTPPSTSPTDRSLETDGPWIAFQALYSATDLGLMRPDGSESHRIPGGPGNRWHPDWSPDGTSLAYDYDLPSGVDEIWMLRVDGSEERAVTQCVDACIGHQGAAWSPDGTSIGFDAAEDASDEYPDGLCYVGLVDVASSAVSRILEFPGCQSDEFEGLTETIFMRFSPDGGRIVLQGMGPDNQTAIFTATVDGQELQQITDWGFGARPDWSPDGDWIVFQSVQPETNPGTSISIHRIRPDGTDIEQLTSPVGTVIDVYPRYAPDATAILFSRCPVSQASNCEARSMSPDGAEDTLVATGFATHGVHVIAQPSR